MDTADGLHLLGGVENGLDEEHMGGLDQVESVSTGVDGKQEHRDILTVTECGKVQLGKKTRQITYLYGA